MFIKYFISLFFIITLADDQKKFTRNFDSQGVLLSEGWTLNGQKTDFWTYYHINGRVAKKGHFDEGKKNGYWYFYSENSHLIKEGAYLDDRANDWWIFYNEYGTLKIQFKSGMKNGLALVYQNSRLKKALRYDENKKIGEWTSYVKFKRDNPDLEF